MSLIVDFDEERIAMMDRCGIDISVLSQTAPGVQCEPDSSTAIKAARANNDFLADRISKHPNRFRGFACVAMQDPVAAADELERCIRTLGFVGVLVNGHTRGEYLDDPQCDHFWERLSDLGVPLYLHPGNLYDKPHMFKGCPGLSGATWSWTCETATHALRLVFNGVFDRYPNLKIILGHMGETLPFVLWRLDSRALITSYGQALRKPPSTYIREHIVITTSGVCANGPLLCSLTELGEDSVMFSTDYPYEDPDVAANFIENAPLTHAQKEKVCFRNAERVLKI